MKKPPICDADRKKRCAVTAKRSDVVKTQKAAAKKLKLQQGAWVADFSDVEENDESDDEEEDDDEGDIINDDEEMEGGADDYDDFLFFPYLFLFLFIYL